MEKVNIKELLSESIKNTRNNHDAAIMFFKELSTNTGIHLRPSILPKIFHFGENNDIDTHTLVSRIIIPDYAYPETLFEELKGGGIALNCDSYLAEKNLYGNTLAANFIDHNRTLKTLKALGNVKDTTPSSEAQQCLSHMRNIGVCFCNEPWEEQLPKEYTPLIKNPNYEIDFYAASGKDLTRCKTGWTKTSSHQGDSIYKLTNGWTNGLEGGMDLSRKIEAYHDDRRFFFTDSMCPACEESIEKEMLE